MRKTLPFGIAQTGKAFRNEISPRDFIFRLREFEQCEVEFFCEPSHASRHYMEWLEYCRSFLKRYGLKDENVRVHMHGKDELAHYAQESCDLEYKFPHGWGELWGIANRGDYDLKAHAAASKKELHYVSPDGGQQPIYPYVIEPAVGLDRLVYAFLSDAYREEMVGEEVRAVLSLDKRLAPFRFAVLPLSKQEPLVKIAREIHAACLTRSIRCDVDITQSIGKRYRRQDEIGTPQCVTVDFDSLKDQCVTIRDRDTMKQSRLPIAQFIAELASA
jgi:glycyl-tRNA synthetase